MEAESISDRGSVSTSPEFEFWMFRNPTNPQPEILSADELFADGVLLPLHHRPSGSDIHSSTPPSDILLETLPGTSPSKRWRDIFRKSHKKIVQQRSNGGTASRSAELNINLWPFSRSRSAGTNAGRPRIGGITRKVSSAPCSRSNSAGESKSRKWPSSPSRPGAHPGRTSPVWPVRRHAVRNNTLPKGGANSSDVNGAKARVLNMNVPMCIGYHRQQMSCSKSAGDVNGGVGSCHGGKGGSGGGRRNRSGSGDQIGGVGAGGSNFFKLRGLFVKKVH